MFLTEWNWDDALAVSREEGREEGWGERDIVIAQNALAKGLPLELIHDLTGLDVETIERLQHGDPELSEKVFSDIKEEMFGNE